MNGLEKLARYRDAILQAEIVGWLHNLGKLDPNFLVQQTGESPEILELCRVEGQYSFRRFTRPSILHSSFPYEDLIGVLYFVDLEARRDIEKLSSQIEEIRTRLSLSGVPDRAGLGHELQRLVQERNTKQNALRNNEHRVWQEYEKRGVDNYEPGTAGDPDYMRNPKPDVVLNSGFSMEIPALLLLAHGEVSGQEKKGVDLKDRYIEVENYHDQTPKLDNLRLATAFGHEISFKWCKWPQKRRDIVDLVFDHIWNAPVQQRYGFLETTQHLAITLGDTQRPINEISLWDYSQSTAALFKTSIVQSVITGQMPTPADMRWRLAAVRLDAFDFIFQANQVSDLIARRHLLQGAWQKIRCSLEVETPIGSAVYTDEHGLVFVLPELPGWSESAIENSLRTVTLKALDDSEIAPDELEFYGLYDIRPTVKIGPPQRGKKLNLQEPLPKEEPVSKIDPLLIQTWWRKDEKNREQCSVCQLRPIGYMEPGLPSFVTAKKAEERKLCGICLARRGRRAQEWIAQQPRETIWIDEVADTNGRTALITGTFALDPWLDGTLVRSLAIGTDKAGNWLAKPPTFARIQRVWRTTQQFWQESQNQVFSTLADDRRRIHLWFDKTPDLGDFHVYELELGGTTLSVVWYPPQDDGTGGYLISADNLGYVARQLDADKATYADPALAAIWVEDYIKQRFVDGNVQPVLRNPDATPAERTQNLIAGSRIVRTDHQDAAYSSAIPILAEPRTFMALVPADQALDVVQAIQTKYAREMGKVRNRLPLHLGIVYAHRRTPLRAVLDAGRRMLGRVAGGEWRVAGGRWQVAGGEWRGASGEWQVAGGGGQVAGGEWRVATPVKSLSRNELPEDLTDGTAQFDRTVAVKLEQDGRTLTWHVPAVMGDGQTEDQWYPYVFLQTAAEPTDRNRRFQAPNPWTGQDGWLVHAGDLCAGDQVHFTPATLDFEWLDSAARRFEIAYDAQGRRLGRPTRPYLLDELDTLTQIWRTLSYHLTQTQVHALRDLVEHRREEWRPADIQPGSTFWQLCRDAVANAAWQKGVAGGETARKGQMPWQVECLDRKEWLDRWAGYAVRGWLNDVVELRLQVMKEELETAKSAP